MKTDTKAIRDKKKVTISERLTIQKTYKIYIGGKFPRTESGRYYNPVGQSGKSLGNMCLCSGKDIRDAVVAARSAQSGWNATTAFNKSQIIYRIAELLEGRKTQFIEELTLQGLTKKEAEEEVNLSIDRLIYYSGWADKYQQVFSSVNPVASSHFNFSVYEPSGVVAIIAPEDTSLIGLVSAIVPTSVGGNTCIVLASENLPLCAVTFAEVLNSSDVPSGVVNILTGKKEELVSKFATHMDINTVIYNGNDSKLITDLQAKSSLNLKRVIIRDKNWKEEASQDPYLILDTQEVKTTWHPIENSEGASLGY